MQALLVKGVTVLAGTDQLTAETSNRLAAAIDWQLQELEHILSGIVEQCNGFLATWVGQKPTLVLSTAERPLVHGTFCLCCSVKK